MAIDLSVQYPGKITAPSANYPYGEAQNITTPGDGTGTPWEEALVNDFVGFEQALLKAGGIVPSGSPDTAIASEYLKAVIALASGRGFTYDESGAVNAYVLDVRTDEQFAANLFDGLIVKFTPTITNTGASTLDYNTTIDDIKDESTGLALIGYEMIAGVECMARFDGTDWLLIRILREKLYAPQLTTSGTTKDFSDIPAWAREITVMFNNISSDGTGSFRIQLGDSGGLAVGGYSSGIGSIATSTPGSDAATAGILFNTGTSGAPASFIHGTMVLKLQDPVNDTWIASINTIDTDGDVMMYGTGMISLSGTLDRLRLLNAAGDTWDSGSINVSCKG